MVLGARIWRGRLRQLYTHGDSSGLHLLGGRSLNLIILGTRIFSIPGPIRVHILLRIHIIIVVIIPSSPQSSRDAVTNSLNWQFKVMLKYKGYLRLL